MQTPESQTAPVRSTRMDAPAASLVRVLAMLLLFCAAAVYESLHLSSLTDTDVWWHLSTGLWILQNHAVPHSGLFSQYPNLPWIASSWLYDLLLATAYKLLGLRALPVMLMLGKVALAVSAFLLARSRSRNFPFAVLLAIAVQCAIPLRPLPNLCSIVCFALELAFLFQSRRAGDVRILYWLPLLFVLWVNLHIQFVYGLVALVLFLAATLVEDISRRSGSTWCDSQLPLLPVGVVAAVTVFSIVATLLSPYSYRIYELVIQNATPAGYIADEHAMSFRQSQHYVLLLLAMAAFLALGRRRSRDPFKLSLMVVASMLAFRIKGDAGFLAMASVAVIADAFFTKEIGSLPRSPERRAHWEMPATILLLAVVLVAAACRFPSRQTLLNRMGENFPVRAADYIRENRLPDPLFNEYVWGGFLTFYLPGYPVAIDGRTDLYGEEIITRYFKVTRAEVPLNTDPTFAAAQTILLPADSAMAIALAKFSDFKAVYGDSIATVLVRQN
jgi:hypothetical protein